MFAKKELSVYIPREEEYSIKNQLMSRFRLQLIINFYLNHPVYCYMYYWPYNCSIHRTSIEVYPGPFT